MLGNNRTNFSYLNRDGEWPDFHRSGLELLDDGSLELYRLPIFEGVLPPELEDAKEADGLSGIAVSDDGTIFYSDTDNNRIHSVDWCDNANHRVECMGGEGHGLTQFDRPRALFIPKHRRSLFVADSGNNRIQIFDLDSLQLVDVMGQKHPADTTPGSDPGLLDNPWDLDGDRDGNLYIVDYGNHRVQKFNRAGVVVPSFWEAMRASADLVTPSAIAVTGLPVTLIYILDESKRLVFVFDSSGNAIQDAQGAAVSFGEGFFEKPMGLAASGESVYVGDNAIRRVLSFKKTDGYRFAGEAVGYEGPVAALALADRRALFINAGDGRTPLQLSLQGGYRRSGLLWSKAIKVREYEVAWHRLQSIFTIIGSSAHIRLFVHTSNDKQDRPVVNVDAADPFSDSRWRPASNQQFSDLDDLFIGGEPALFLWIGAMITGDGRSTPVLRQLKVEFDHETYLKNLPAIYREESECGDVLKRLLSLFETFFDGAEKKIENLALVFDPHVIPSEFLAWLAGWLALELDDQWDDSKKRLAITKAFEMYGRRGTVRGLRDAVRFALGIDVTIEEPILQTEWWALPGAADGCKCKKGAMANKAQMWSDDGNSILGVTTMLAGAHAQGAVIGSTATLDQSHLISDEELGAPLFVDLAHRFTVQVLRGELKCANSEERIRDLLRREKPAHTEYHLCIVEPLLRVGFQARVGIDAVVGGAPVPTGLGDERGTVISGHASVGLGRGSAVGQTTRVV